MKKYLKEIILLLIQLFIFYIIPLINPIHNPFGMILLIIIFTLINSIIVGLIINNKLKYLYPLIISILFIPSVFIYYNESALIHSIWYLVISSIGTIIGRILK